MDSPASQQATHALDIYSRVHSTSDRAANKREIQYYYFETQMEDGRRDEAKNGWKSTMFDFDPDNSPRERSIER